MTSKIARLFLAAQLTGLLITNFARAGYDPTIGRWLSRDPMNNAELNQGTNLYSYVQNDPINKWDPTGLKCILTATPMHSLFYGIGQLIYIQGDDGTCPKCPYPSGTILEAPIENLMQLVPRIIVGEDRFRNTTGVDIRLQVYDPFHPRA